MDGLIFELQPTGGVARIYREIIPRLCDLDPAARIELLINRRSRYGIPRLKQIDFRLLLPPVDRILRPRRWLWPIIPLARRLVIGRSTRDLRDAIWHSTYHTSPDQWRGPIVTTVHDLIHEQRPDLQPGGMNDLIRRQKRQSILEASAIICVSRTTAEDVRKIYDIREEKIQVIHLGYNPVFRPMTQALRPIVDRPFVLYVGSREAYKNFSLLLQAYALWKENRAVTLLVVGRQWTGGERRQLHALGIENRVQILSKIDDTALCQLYNQAEAFIYPSLYEGFGLPLLEAAACGCPIVGSQIPSNIEIAGQTPIYFQPTRVESLNTALNTALSEGRGSERTQQGLNMVKNYSWDQTARETLALYRSLI